MEEAASEYGEIPANILNKQPQTADKGGSPRWSLEEGLQLLTVKKILTCCEIGYSASKLDGSFTIQFLNQLRKWKLLKREYAPWSYLCHIWCRHRFKTTLRSMHGILCMSVVKSTNTVAVRNFKTSGIQAA
jgi:hypothetical protein